MNFYTIFYKILFKFQNIKYGKNLKSNTGSYGFFRQKNLAAIRRWSVMVVSGFWLWVVCFLINLWIGKAGAVTHRQSALSFCIFSNFDNFLKAEVKFPSAFVLPNFQYGGSKSDLFPRWAENALAQPDWIPLTPPPHLWFASSPKASLGKVMSTQSILVTSAQPWQQANPIGFPE